MCISLNLFSSTLIKLTFPSLVWAQIGLSLDRLFLLKHENAAAFRHGIGVKYHLAVAERSSLAEYPDTVGAPIQVPTNGRPFVPAHSVKCYKMHSKLVTLRTMCWTCFRKNMLHEMFTLKIDVLETRKYPASQVNTRCAKVHKYLGMTLTNKLWLKPQIL